MNHTGWLLGAGLLLAGCSSTSTPSARGLPDAGGGGGDGSAGSMSTGSCTSSPVVWQDDGTQHCASYAEAIVSSNTVAGPIDGGPVVYTSLELVVTQNGTSDIFSFDVTSSLPLGGTYGCTIGQTSSVLIDYDEVGVFSTSVVSCSISVTVTPTDGGAAVVSGTFSAQLAVTDGGMKTLSGGTFDLPETNGNQ